MYLSTALLTIALIFIRTPPIYGFHLIARIEPINKSVKPMKDPPHKSIIMIKNRLEEKMATMEELKAVEISLKEEMRRVETSLTEDLRRIELALNALGAMWGFLTRMRLGTA
jgi:hypothetical protein